MENSMQVLVGLLSGSSAQCQLEAAHCVHQLSSSTCARVGAACLPATPYLITYLSGQNAKFTVSALSPSYWRSHHHCKCVGFDSASSPIKAYTVPFWLVVLLVGCFVSMPTVSLSLMGCGWSLLSPWLIAVACAFCRSCACTPWVTCVQETWQWGTKFWLRGLSRH